MRERAIAVTENGLWYMTVFLILYDSCFSLCCVFFVLQCYLENPPDSIGSLCRTRRIWACTKWPNQTHSPRWRPFSLRQVRTHSI